MHIGRDATLQAYEYWYRYKYRYILVGEDAYKQKMREGERKDDVSCSIAVLSVCVHDRMCLWSYCVNMVLDMQVGVLRSMKICMLVLIVHGAR